MKQQVDALWICNILQWRIIREDIVHRCLFTYLREASAVARSSSLGNVRASKGDSFEYRLSRFFFIDQSANEVSPAAIQTDYV